MKLTDGQKKAIKTAKKGKNCLILGSAGTGKSTVIKEIIKELHITEKRVLVCAPTGIAALNVEGITIHRAFNFSSTVQINLGKNRRATVKTRTSGVVSSADVIIIDEISMVRMDLFDAIIASIRKIESKQNRKIQIILAGDFFQLPPIMTAEDKKILDFFYKKDVGYGYAFQSAYWHRCSLEPVILDEIVRQTDSEFIQALNQLRIGDCNCFDFFNSTNTKKNVEGIHIFSHNYNVDRFNFKALKELAGNLLVSETFINYLPGFDESNIDPAVLNAVPKTLHLKEGAKVIITINDDHMHRHARELTSQEYKFEKNKLYFSNGSFATLQELCQSTDSLSAIVIVNKRILEIDAITYPIYDYIIEENDLKKICVATYTQLPLKLAYAITVHRSQGQTYDSAIIHPGAFLPGQTYVACSRVKTQQGLCLSRTLKENDIMISQEVEAFNNTVTKIANKEIHKKMGRPAKNENGSTRNKLIWVPKALEKHVKREVDQNRAIPLHLDKISHQKGRIHIRVPEFLHDHIQEEIRTYKNSKLL